MKDPQNPDAHYAKRAKKHFGQNFINDKSIIDRILASLPGSLDGLALVEIGPGLGALSRGLIDRYDGLLAYEIDASLCGALTQTFRGEIELYHDVAKGRAAYLECHHAALRGARASELTSLARHKDAIMSGASGASEIGHEDPCIQSGERSTSYIHSSLGHVPRGTSGMIKSAVLDRQGRSGLDMRAQTAIKGGTRSSAPRLFLINADVLSLLDGRTRAPSDSAMSTSEARGPSMPSQRLGGQPRALNALGHEHSVTLEHAQQAYRLGCEPKSQGLMLEGTRDKQVAYEADCKKLEAKNLDSEPSPVPSSKALEDKMPSDKALGDKKPDGQTPSGKKLASGGPSLDKRGGILLDVPYYLAANLPYNVGTKIVLALLGDPLCHGFTVMTQLEVARKFCTSDNPLGILASIAGSVRFLFEVPRQSFTPAPKVTSALFSFTRIKGRNKMLDSNTKGYLDGVGGLLRMGFSAPRKRLHKNLSTLLHEHPALQSALAKYGPSVRAHEIDVKTYQNLYEIIQKETT